MDEFMFDNKRCTANQLIDACVFDDRYKIIAAVFHFMKATCSERMNASMNRMLYVVVVVAVIGMCIYLGNRGAKHCQHLSIAIVIA